MDTHDWYVEATQQLLDTFHISIDAVRAPRGDEMLEHPHTWVDRIAEEYGLIPWTY